MVAVSLYRYPDCAYTFIFRSFLNAPICNPSFLSHPSYSFSVFNHIGIMPFYAFNSLRNWLCFPMLMIILRICCVLMVQCYWLVRINGIFINDPLMSCAIWYQLHIFFSTRMMVKYPPPRSFISLLVINHVLLPFRISLLHNIHGNNIFYFYPRMI